MLMFIMSSASEAVLQTISQHLPAWSISCVKQQRQRRVQLNRFIHIGAYASHKSIHNSAYSCKGTGMRELNMSSFASRKVLSLRDARID